MSKNTRNRILLTAVAALLLVTLTIGGTVAWLQDKTQTITNTFTTSEVDIELTETEFEDKMIPGDELDKNPLVTVKADSEACWLFVKIEESSVLDDYISYTVDPAWKAVSGYDGVYYIKVADTDADQEFEVLAGNKVTVLGAVTEDDMAALEVANATQPTLTFTAYAIQQLGFDNETAAWAEILTRTDNKAATNP